VSAPLDGVVEVSVVPVAAGCRVTTVVVRVLTGSTPTAMSATRVRAVTATPEVKKIARDRPRVIAVLPA
jgi:hypothetical protein